MKKLEGMREREKRRGRKGRRKGESDYEKSRDQKVRNEASQLVRERREDDVDDESLASEWEQKRKTRAERSNKKVPCKKGSASERARASR